MIKQTSEEFRKLFLLKFTRELIRNSRKSEITKLEIILEKRKKEGEIGIKEKIEGMPQIVKQITSPPRKVITQELPVIYPPAKTIAPPRKMISQELPVIYPPAQQKPAIMRATAPRVLTIPEPKLPKSLQYLKPIPTNLQINLGKLDPLINDPLVSSIECNGPDEKIIVRVPAAKPTNITLSKEEIDEIIKKFSEATKIPVQEGVFRVAFGRLVFSAIISEVIGSKFIIKKMTPPPTSPRYIP